MPKVTQDETIKGMTTIIIHHLIRFMIEESKEYTGAMNEIAALKNKKQREKAMLEYVYALGMTFSASYIKIKDEDKKTYDANLIKVAKALDEFHLKLNNVTKTNMKMH